MSLEEMSEEQLRAHLKKQETVITAKNKEIDELKNTIEEKKAQFEEFEAQVAGLKEYKRVTTPFFALIEQVIQEIPKIIEKLKEEGT